MFMEMFCLNMQISYYLIKYALICKHFQNKQQQQQKARFKILVAFCWHILDISFYYFIN